MFVFGGLALFLFGLDQMTDALKIIAGDRMKSLLARLTTNRFKAVFAGAFVTSIIQSSSVTTVLVVGFISAGLMTLSQSIGVILGADIGTTITAQIVAFKVTQFALIPVALGFAMLFCFKNETIRHYGHMIMGLGLIFFGMQLMSDGTRPLRTYEPFIDMMRRMDDPLMGILIGAVFTGIIQSSSASIGIVIVLASQGFISLEAGIALAFGANIGTCVTALLASLGKPREAVRSAGVHILFKIVGVLIWLGFISQLADIVRWMSPSHPELADSARLAAETPRQIANAHTVFNVANTLLFIWFTTPLATLMRRIVPDRRLKVETTYLDDLLIRTPSLAMHMIRLELGRLGAGVLWMVREGLEPALSGTAAALSEIRRKELEVDLMHGAIIRYLGQLSKETMSDELTTRLHDSMAAANYLENMGDMVESHLLDAGGKRLKRDMEVSAATQEVVRNLHRRVTTEVERAVEALVSSDRTMAMSVADAKEDVNALVAQAEERIASRLAADAPHRLAAFKLESDLVESLKRIYYFAKRIAKIVIEHEAEETASNPPDESADA
ncbi:MAG: Na/Pi cotransporter family protein [Planctomycetes bacterium]|nr:Na/Pi cotransporter family protein [Planctomycetota bacterium]